MYTFGEAYNLQSHMVYLKNNRIQKYRHTTTKHAYQIKINSKNNSKLL